MKYLKIIRSTSKKLLLSDQKLNSNDQKLISPSYCWHERYILVLHNRKEEKYSIRTILHHQG